MMNMTARTWGLWLAIGMLSLLAGCADRQQQPSADNGGAAHEHAGDHDHDHEQGHDHDHEPGQDHGHDQGHGHHGAGPHGGTLADWGGGKFHVEFTVDHDQQEATVYILGEDAKTPLPIAADQIQLSIEEPATQLALAAVPQEGDPEGRASRFAGKHDNLGVVREYSGTITGVIDDTPYSGDFREEPHGAED